MDEKLKKIIFLVLVGFVLLFLFLFILSSCESKISPSELETRIVDSATTYYENHQEELPKEGSVTTLSLGDLVNKGIIKELDKILEKNTTCSGTLYIENNNNYYMYSPKLNCNVGTETYKTENLKETLLDNVVSSGNGLYQMYDSYYFRGDNVNNYIIFDGIMWRITKINSDGSIRLLENGIRDSLSWDNRFNTDINEVSGINNYFNNSLNSRIKEHLDKIYNDEDILTNNAKGYIKKTSLCVGKRNINDSINDGSIECSETLNDQYLGLLQLNEFFLASLDPNFINPKSYSCINYNYLTSLESTFWSITASSENSYKVYKISSGTVDESDASGLAMARMVINLSENTNVSGSGTKEDPYIVSGFDSKLKDLY